VVSPSAAASELFLIDFLKFFTSKASSPSPLHRSMINFHQNTTIKPRSTKKVRKFISFYLFSLPFSSSVSVGSCYWLCCAFGLVVWWFGSVGSCCCAFGFVSVCAVLVQRCGGSVPLGVCGVVLVMEICCCS